MFLTRAINILSAKIYLSYAQTVSVVYEPYINEKNHVKND